MAKKSKSSTTNVQSNDSQSLQKTLEKALQTHQSGDFKQAESLYSDILAQDPSHPYALHYLGVMALQLGNHELAIAYIDRATASKPDYVEAHINLGIALKAARRLDEAVNVLQQALNIKPNDAQAHYNLGNVYRQQGNIASAEQSYRKAISANPKYALAQYNLGTVLADQGRPDEAITCFRSASTLDPKNAEIFNSLGNAYHDQGMFDDAVKSYKTAIVLQPRDAFVHNNLGNTLKEKGDLESSAESFKRAIALDPEFAVAHRNLGVLYRELGEMEEAKSCFQRAIEISPDYAAAYRNLSMIVKFTEQDEFVKKMESLYRQKDLSYSARIDLGFALGKIYEDLKKYKKAFEYLQEANQTKRTKCKSSLEVTMYEVDSIKKTFTKDFFDSTEATGISDNTPIFILGMPRSGTTLVEQILSSHPSVFGAGELDILNPLWEKALQQGLNDKNSKDLIPLSPTALKEMGQSYINELRKHAPNAEKITDKMPYNFFHVGLIKAILPNAKIIHCKREPMDNCLSIYKTEFVGEHYYAYDMEELGKYYNLYSDLMSYWESVLPDYIHTQQYEELVSDQENQTRRLLEFCDLSWDESCLNFEKTKRRVRTASLAQVRQPIYQDSVDLWKQYDSYLGPLKKALAGTDDGAPQKKKRFRFW